MTTVPPIPRRLKRHEPPEGEVALIDEAEALGLPAPIVVVGDPGAGKSVLMETFGQMPGAIYLRAGAFVRHADPARLVGAATRLIVDGVDEVASNAAGGGVEAVLRQLSALGHPDFVLSCRAADWRGAADRIRIEDDYGRPATLLSLLPFDRDDARLYLQTRFPALEADDVLAHLDHRGLADIYGNPLTLKLFGEVAEQGGRLPETRAELLEASCPLLLREENERHMAASHAARPADELLLGAGAAFAALLLCDHLGIHTGAAARRPAAYAGVGELESLPFGTALADALKTRLFASEGETRFVPIHRVVAEFLAAKWLAACVEGGASEARILALVRQNGAVPTSLRGLNAWLAHFSPALAERCVSDDPYGVLRYGDADRMTLPVARILLASLAALSRTDPYFRAEDWSRHSARALARPELRREIGAILANPGEHSALGALLIDAMAATMIGADMAAEMRALMLDPERIYAQRHGALNLIADVGLVDDWPGLLDALQSLGDDASLRLAMEALMTRGLEQVPAGQAVSLLLAYTGVTFRPVPRARSSRSSNPRTVLRHLLAKPIDLIEAWLDALAERAAPFMREGGDGRSEIGDLVRKLAARRFALGPAPSAEQVVRWLLWLDRHYGYDRASQDKLRDHFQAETALRRDIQARILFEAPDGNAWAAAFRLGDGLYPNDADIIDLLGRWEEREARTEPDDDIFRDLVRLARSQEGLSPEVAAATRRYAGGNPTRLSIVAELAAPIRVEPDPELEAIRTEQEAERETVFASHREFVRGNLADIDADGASALITPAAAYLGRYHEVDGETGPERLDALLGPDLAAQVRAGFIATLGRTNLPTALEIATAHAVGNHYPIEEVLICGLAELVRQGRSLAEVPAPNLASAHMAWRRTPESNGEDHLDIDEPLRTLMLGDEAATELFHRTSIEPQLSADASHVYDLYHLTHLGPLTSLAGRLAREWLIGFPGMRATTLAELMPVALNEPVAAQAMVRASRTTVCADRDALDLWMAADFLVDFAAREADLRDAADEDRGMLWRVRTLIEGIHGGGVRSLAIEQLGFIVERFAASWPHVERPSGVTSGENNPWDATQFIEHCIYALAALPDAEAGAALAELQERVGAGYEGVLAHARLQQRRVRDDHDYQPASLAELQSVARGGLPESIDDLRAFFADRTDLLRRKLRGNELDSWVVYWDRDTPHGETYCRNRLIEQVSGELPAAIRFAPEEQMPGETRADIAVTCGTMSLPVEIKGQWHPDVWTAASGQLDTHYTRTWRAEGRGLYIVLWFGDVPGKNLPPHPNGLAAPDTPEALAAMLTDLIPELRRGMLDVHVVDVSGTAEGRARLAVGRARKRKKASAGPGPGAPEPGTPTSAAALRGRASGNAQTDA